MYPNSIPYIWGSRNNFPLKLMPGVLLFSSIIYAIISCYLTKLTGPFNLKKRPDHLIFITLLWSWNLMNNIGHQVALRLTYKNNDKIAIKTAQRILYNGISLFYIKI